MECHFPEITPYLLSGDYLTALDKIQENDDEMSVKILRKKLLHVDILLFLTEFEDGLKVLDTLKDEIMEDRAVLTKNYHIDDDEIDELRLSLNTSYLIVNTHLQYDSFPESDIQELLKQFEVVNEEYDTLGVEMFTRAKYHFALAHVYRYFGRYQQAIEELEEAIDVFNEDIRIPGCGEVLFIRGLIIDELQRDYYKIGNIKKAIIYCLESHNFWTQFNNTKKEATAHYWLSRYYEDINNQEQMKYHKEKLKELENG